MAYFLKCRFFDRAPAEVKPYEQFITFKVHETNKNSSVKVVIDNKEFPPMDEE